AISAIATFAPTSEKARTISAPMLVAPPATKATRPSKSSINQLLSRLLGNLADRSHGPLSMDCEDYTRAAIFRCVRGAAKDNMLRRYGHAEAPSHAWTVPKVRHGCFHRRDGDAASIGARYAQHPRFRSDRYAPFRWPYAGASVPLRR